MPRHARSISSSGIYHIMLRGINRQNIFEDEEDIEKFIETIKKYKEISNYEIYAYCIMSNHIHMLIKEQDEPISNSVKRISSSFVFWYNKKYERCGHLFQDRFKSEPVENDEYFLTVLRYIHQNPLKAGLVKVISEYKWSSYNEYIDNATVIQLDFALDIFSPDKKSAVNLFRNFHSQMNNDYCMENEEKAKVSDIEVKEFIFKYGITDLKEVRQLEKRKRDEVIKVLKLINGVTIRQIARITGISKSVIDRL